MSDQEFRDEIQPGMEVVGSDGGEIGMVTSVHADDLLVNRRLRRDAYIPYNAVVGVSGGRVILAATEDEVDYIASLNPPITGGPGETYREEER